MSKTDKTEPGWLAEFRHARVAHDHRAGECIPETFDDVRRDAGGVPSRYLHSRRCPRVEWVDTPCPGHLLCRRAADALAERIRWSREDFEGHGLRSLLRHDAERPYFCERGHRERVDHPELACEVCDLGPRPTCELRTGFRYSLTLRLYGAGVPAWNRRLYETSARQSTRVSLVDARRDYNANGDTEVEVEPTRHRHGAARNWW